MSSEKRLPKRGVEEDYDPELDLGDVDPDSDIDASIVAEDEDNEEGHEAVVDEDDDDDEDEEPSSPNPPSDDEITFRVRRLLRSDSATSMLRISVSTEEGVVTLRGMVQTLDDTDNAAEVASRIEGVVDVLDELEVEL
jgi:osmotically-inducible protein OsmY